MQVKLILIALLAAGFSTLRVEAQFGQLNPAGQELLEQAESGDADAQFQLGLSIVTGQNSTKSSKAQGAMWIQKAAKQGHDKAMHVLGALYEEGVGVAQDFKLAAQWHEKAAEKGLAEAQTAIALMYTQGKGVAKDDAKALGWVQKAAAQNHAPAQALYGSMLVRGDGTPKNGAKAAMWFLRSAKQDNGFAQRQLAYLYYTGNGVPIDYARCEAWYRRAAQNPEDPWAKNDLAWFLATCPDDKFHSGRDAVEIAKEAIKAVESENGEQRHEMIDTMAAALARCGQYGEAALWQKRCITLLKDDKVLEEADRKKLEDEFAERLKLYQERKPYSDKAAKPEKEGEPLLNDDVLDAKKKEAPRKPFAPPQAPKPEHKESVT